MAQLTDTERFTVSKEIQAKLNRLNSDKGRRSILYDLRKGYYDGTIKPVVERGHDLIYTQFAATIVDRFAAYMMANGFTIKLKPTDVADPVQVSNAVFVNSLADDLYNNSPDFQYQAYLLAFLGGLYGDSFLGTKIVDGVPEHYTVAQPHNVMLGFRDDNYNEFDYYAYEQGMSVDAIEQVYGIKVSATSMPSKPGYVYGSMNTHRNPFGDTGDNINEARTAPDTDSNMASVVVVHDFITKKRTQLFNGKAYFQDEELSNFYHYVGNFDPNNGYGVSDFETCAQLITKLEQKLSEESDAVSHGTHLKIITDRNAKELQEKWKPYKTQAFEVPSTPKGNGRLEVLNTNISTYSSQQLVAMLMNILRTNSGLQELGQDQIAANVSGRAIAYMFQGVILKIKAKRMRFNSIMTQMVIDDLEIIAKENPELKKMCFKDGKFQFKINVKYPPVLEQDEQIRLANINLMSTGDEPLISKYSARQLILDYIDDPLEEEKRIQQEKDAIMERQAKLAAAQAAAAAKSAPGGPASITPGGMDTATADQGQGVPSTPGNAGGAQQGVSPAGYVASTNQQSTGSQN
jgi:hypothetical protein